MTERPTLDASPTVLLPAAITEPPDAPDLDAPDGEAAAAWRIEHDGHAEWALRRLAEARHAYADVCERAEAWHRQIDEWAQREAARPQRDIAYFTAVLEVWALEQRDTGAKSRSLPTGRVQTRAVPARIVVADPDAVLAWAKAQPDPDRFVVRTEIVSNAMLANAARIVDDAKAVDADGVVIPGVDVEPGRVTVTVQIDPAAEVR